FLYPALPARSEINPSFHRHEHDAHRNGSLQIGAGRRERAGPAVHAEFHDVARILVFHEEIVGARIESEMARVFSSGVGLARGRQLAVGSDREYRDVVTIAVGNI